MQPNGTLTDIKVLKGVDKALNDEVIRVLQLSPVWKPAKHEGKIVKQRIVFPVAFKLDGSPADQTKTPEGALPEIFVVGYTSASK